MARYENSLQTLARWTWHTFLYCVAAIAFLAIAHALIGCSSVMKEASSQPGGVYCNGSVSVSGTGAATVAAVFGGGEANGWSIVTKCEPNSYVRWGPGATVGPPAPVSGGTNVQ